jgi:hypothetical protein
MLDLFAQLQKARTLNFPVSLRKYTTIFIFYFRGLDLWERSLLEIN